jgi:hypothetical protein
MLGSRQTNATMNRSGGLKAESPVIACMRRESGGDRVTDQQFSIVLFHLRAMLGLMRIQAGILLGFAPAARLMPAKYVHPSQVMLFKIHFPRHGIW